MIDRHAVILESRGAERRSLPVLTGIDPAMTLEQSLRRIRLFEAVMRVFGDADASLAEAVSEIDVSDVSDAVVLVRHEGLVVKIRMGDDHLEHRLNVFLSYIETWKKEFGPLESVDLRFEKQVPVRPAGMGGKNG